MNEARNIKIKMDGKTKGVHGSSESDTATLL